MWPLSFTPREKSERHLHKRTHHPFPLFGEAERSPSEESAGLSSDLFLLLWIILCRLLSHLEEERRKKDLILRLLLGCFSKKGSLGSNCFLPFCLRKTEISEQRSRSIFLDFFRHFCWILINQEGCFSVPCGCFFFRFLLLFRAKRGHLFELNLSGNPIACSLILF